MFVLDPEAGPGAVQAAVYGALFGGDGFRVQVRGAALSGLGWPCSGSKNMAIILSEKPPRLVFFIEGQQMQTVCLLKIHVRRHAGHPLVSGNRSGSPSWNRFFG